MRNEIILILTLITAASELILCVPATSDEADESLPRYRLDLIVTTALRESEDFFYTVEELTAKDLREWDAQTAADALDLISGLRTKISRAGHGQYVSLRAFEQQHLLILVDGVPLYNPYDGLLELDHIPAEQIEAIRVIKGPSSVRYGPNALGGVIQIITRNAGQKASRGAVAEVGENGTYNIRLRHGWQRGPLSVRFSGSLARSDGFRLSENFRQTPVPNLPDGQGFLDYEDGGRRDNSDYVKSAAHLTFSYRSGERLHLDLAGSLVNNEWGVPPHTFYNPDKNKTTIRYWRFNNWRQGSTSLNAGIRLNEALTGRAMVFFNKYDNTLDSYDGDTYSSQEKGFAFHSIYDDHALGGRLQLTGDLGRAGSATIGAGMISDLHKDTPDRAEPAEQFRTRTWWTYAENRIRITGRMTGMIGAGYSVLTKKEAGDLTDAGEDLSAFNPSFSLAWLISPAVSAHLSLARQSRFPTMKQLFGEDGNPSLKAQRSDHLELGGEWAADERTHLRASLFYDLVRDLIEGNYISRTTVNVEKARIWGAELTFQGNPFSGLNITLGYAYLRAENTSTQRPGDHLQYRPEHQLDWNFGFDAPQGMGVFFSGSAFSRQYFYDDFRDRHADHLAPYAIGNLTVRRGFSFGLEPFLTVHNILDAAYQDIYTSPSPGRQIRAGARMSW